MPDDQQPSQASSRLNELLAQPGANLDALMATVASVDGSNGPSEEAVSAAFDAMAEPLKERLQPTGKESVSTPEILTFVFGDLAFTGNTIDYYNPANSLIHRVLERRKGIPITLAAVAAEIGRRLGNDLRLVGMPGHVLLSEASEPSRWYDPFNGGVVLTYDDCRALFARFHQIEAFEPSMLDPMGNEAFVIRSLNNLRVAYSRDGRASDIVPVLELRANMASAQPGDRLDLANLLATVGRFDLAADQYEILAELEPERAEVHKAKAHAHRAHRN